jgi:hypothetical protein
MRIMPEPIVFSAGAVVVLAAAAGLYLGVSRSLTAPAGAEEIAVLPAATAPIANAKAITTPTPTLDEDTVRKLAREEAQAVMAARVAPKRPAASDDDDDGDDDGSSNTTTTATVPLAPARPATPLPTPPGPQP